MYSAQNSAARTAVTDDLSLTASGMAVTCLSDLYLDRANDQYLDDVSESGEYVKDNGDATVTLEQYRAGRRVNAKRQARKEWGVGDVAPQVKATAKGGAGYVRMGRDGSVQVWEQDLTSGTVVRAVCRCGWRVQTTTREAAAKWVVLHAAIYVENNGCL